VRARLAAACAAAHRDPAVVTLIAATKTRTPAEVDAAYACGIRIAGENRAQEFRDKYPLVTAPFEWHFIGQLQSNKLKYLIGKVTCIQSVHSLALAAEIDRLSAKKGVKTAILLEVNLGEANKGGVPYEAVLPLADQAAHLANAPLQGLMTVLPADPSEVERAAARMQTLFAALQARHPACTVLSMGMSGDYPVAAAYGATHIRLGTALFGAR
jgi:pyridoxal phosphate enzyme (YggS family)